MADFIAYPRLMARIAVQGLHCTDMARSLHISRSALYNKLHGFAPFTLEEAIRLKAMLSSSLPLEELFAPAVPSKRI